jgi:DNA-binding NarL/FixJ family response regulator
MSHLRIFLADDHTLVRAGLRALITAEPDLQIVGEASNGHEALAQIPLLQPHIVVMDLSMPELNGIQATRQLVAQMPAIRILALSVHEDASYLQQALHAGAKGYLLKRAAPESLIEAIRTIAGGKTYLDSALNNILIENIVGHEQHTFSDPAILSERETEVLQYIAHGYSNKEIAAQLNLSVRTIETYKNRATEKLGITSRVGIIRYATEQGWLNR